MQADIATLPHLPSGSEAPADPRIPPMPEPTAAVQDPDEVHADMIEAAQAEAENERLTVQFGGETFTAKRNRPAGAFAVMCARLKSKNPGTQTAAPLQLLMSWIEPDDVDDDGEVQEGAQHDRLMEAIGEVDDLEEWMSGEFRVALEAMAQRPSQAL